MIAVCQLTEAGRDLGWIVVDRTMDSAVSPVLWSESEARAFADWYTEADGWTWPTVAARMAAFQAVVMVEVAR